MNAKHYVSLEVAKMLKEKGYNEKTDYFHDDIMKEHFCFTYAGAQNWNAGYNYSAPSLLEVMDFLESNGIQIEIRMMYCKVKGDPCKIADDDEYQWKCYFAICKDDDVKHPIVEEGEDGYVVMYTDRNECMNAAIKKGVELL